MRLVKNHEIVPEQNPSLDIIINAAEQRKKERVIQHDHIRRHDPRPRLLKKAGGPMLLGKLRPRPAQLRRTHSPLRTNLRPHLVIRLKLEIRKAAVLRLARPLKDALQLGLLRRSEQPIRLPERLVQTPRTKIIGPALQHRVPKIHRQHMLQHRQILAHQLFLQIDRVRGNDRLLLARHRVQDGRDQIPQALADARARLHHQMLPALQRLRHGHRHLLLLGTVLKILRRTQQPFSRENRLHLRD